MFSSELEYNVIYLEDVGSIAITSFFSLKSVSHLDLQITERNFYLPGLRNRSLFSEEKTFFCTEESFRNYVVPERRLLYSLNLDVPEGREYSNLRSGSFPADLPENLECFFVAVRVHDNFFRSELVWLIYSVCQQTDCKLKWLKWMANFRPLESALLPIGLQYSCALTLYSDCLDSVFAMKFFEKFIDLITFSRIGELKVLEHFLYTARQLDFEIRGKMTNYSSVTDYCIEQKCFRVVGSILKYEDTAYYNDSSNEDLKIDIYNVRNAIADEDGEFKRLENWKRKSRLYRMMQIIQIFRRHEFYRTECLQCAGVSEALRLVWSSIPDSYVSHQEMAEAYRYLSSYEIRQAHSFYEATIGQIVPYREPRSLTQYCRTAIRRSLCNSKQWLPDGIKQLKLPPRVEYFLNLQTDNLKPDNFQAEGWDKASPTNGVLFESTNRQS